MNRRHSQGHEERGIPRSSTNHQTPPSVESEEERESSLIQLTQYRLLSKNLANVQALVGQRGYPRPDLARRIFDRGDHVESALGAPDPQTGMYGGYTGKRLAEELIHDVNGLIAFVMKYGQVPTIVAQLSERIADMEQIRALLQTEMRTLLQSEVRAVLQQELQGMHFQGPIMPHHSVESAPAKGLLTDIDPSAEAMLDSLF